ncbi:MAG: hypothetical protein QNJ44_08020 [Rhodobacter sp.]|nr:hypothetical protein [Rhodobacter sp.]
MRGHICILVLAVGVCATRAEAHAFQSGADYYAQFLEGASVILRYPEALLPLLSLGVLLSLWHSEGMLRAWPAFLIGQLAGIPLAAVVGPWAISAVLIAGILTATLAALLPRHIRVEALAISLGLGLLVTAASLEGHGFLELPVFIYVGIVFAANLVTACAAGVTGFAMDQVEANWMRILWRIAGSWLAAILTLIFAFTLTAN